MNLFLRNRPRRQRRHDPGAGAPSPAWPRATGGGGGPAARRRVVERQAGADAPHLLGVERFARQQRVGHVEQLLLVLAEDRLRARVVVGHEALHFLIDAERRVLAVVLVLRDLAAEEDLLFLLAEGERTHRVAHAPLADHPAGQIGGALEVVAGAGRDAADGDLLGDAAAEQDRDLILEVLARVVVLLVDRQLHASGRAPCRAG